ncbi:putative nucleic acid-binding Zn ribbon protein [Mesocricetibacter intestinalis]|uniref:Putative nucleic acid-binding Zn ribbon protein n=1 Tax=Mesocricetibacter intestinalis TaxID=1521930 RepID=A0A4R6VBK1_9PAST|nr:Zn-ribbon-containing protein [Mesocricetibacter intestinalis]TDQ59013.1 putative nucleic acid-binding Zn ribbon protein [Mesocricetibacter intestinalis]
MYLTEVFFSNAGQQDCRQQADAVNQIVEQWRYNGQIIGREIPLFLARHEEENGIALRVTCPEQQSLLPDYNNLEVERALGLAEKCGVFLESFQIVADDLNSDVTAENSRPTWQLLYTTYLQSCSPLHSGDDLAPIPLYKQLKELPHLSMDLIKWQENWQACDQLQMNGSILERQALGEISSTESRLFKHGNYLANAIETHTGIPTYYYLYRCGGEDAEQEKNRRCPQCGKHWHLSQPIFDLFHFKCDHCRLLSNLSWNFL